MIQLTGKLLNISANPFTDRQTGETGTTHSAEILHTARGKLEVLALKLDSGLVDSWSKAVGRDIAIEVRSYAMKSSDGGIMSGYAMADKRALPVVMRPAQTTAAAV